MDQVVSEKLTSWAKHTYGFGEGALPCADVVKHRDREHEVEAAVFEWQCRSIDALNDDALAEPRERTVRHRDHLGVVVRGDHAKLGKPLE